jgi:hypothetical protein
MSARGEHCHEIVVKLCRALGRRCRVNYLAVRSGNGANRNRPCLLTSDRHGRCAEAGGEAICAEAAGKYRGISPEIINRIINSSNAIGRAEFSTREDCQARESCQQLQRWLPNKLQNRERTLGWM